MKSKYNSVFFSPLFAIISIKCSFLLFLFDCIQMDTIVIRCLIQANTQQFSRNTINPMCFVFASNESIEKFNRVLTNRLEKIANCKQIAKTRIKCTWVRRKKMRKKKTHHEKCICVYIVQHGLSNVRSTFGSLLQ